MSFFQKVSLSVVCLPAALMLLAGCGASMGTSSVTPEGKPMVGIGGRVHGGQQPVAFTTIQLYTVGTSADGSASTPLLNQTVQTDVNGNFTLTNLYSCTSATQVYVTATGGQPFTGVTNTNLAMMTALGPCSGLTANTFIQINEVTTVAAVSALAPYMKGPTSVGAGSADSADLVNAFAMASILVDPSTGLSPGNGVASGATVPSGQIYLLADILAACINTGGTAAGAGSLCSQLFSLATPTAGSAPVDTVTAMLNIARQPLKNVGSLFNLVSGTAPFPSTITTPPSTLAVVLGANTLSPGYLQVSPSSLDLGTSAATYVTSDQMVTVTNTGGGPASITSYKLMGPDAASFTLELGSGNTAGILCGWETLAAGASCTIPVHATPTANGPLSAWLEIVTSSPNSPILIPLAAAGTAPSAGPISVSSVSFVYDFTRNDVVLSNFGLTPLHIKSVALTDDHSFFIAQNNCGSVLDAQSTCAVVLTPNFPVTGVNPSSTSVLFTTDAASGPVLAVVSANVFCSVAGPSPFTTALGSSSSGVITMGVPHIGQCTIHGQLSSDSSSDFSAGSGCSLSGIFSGGTSSCTVPVTFTPTSSSPRYAKWVLGPGTQSAGSATPSGEYILLSANVTAGQALNVSAPSTLTRALGGSTDPNLPNIFTGTVSVHTGTASPANLSYSFAGTGSDQLSLNTTGCTSLAGNSSCTATLTLLNGGALPSTTVYLLVRDSVSNTTVSQPVTISRTYPQIVIAPSNDTSFAGFLNVGETSDVFTYIVTDQKKYPLTEALSLGATSPMSLTGASTCAANMTVNCTFPAIYTATTAGTNVTGTVTATGQSSGQTTSYAVAAYVLAGTPAISVTPNPIAFANRSVNTTSTVLTVTVKNTGTGYLRLTPQITGASNGNFVISGSTTCPSSKSNAVSPGSTCTVPIVFSPTVTGAQSANLVLTSNAPDSPTSITITGTAQ